MNKSRRRRRNLPKAIALLAMVSALWFVGDAKAGSYEADWLAGTNSSATNYFMGKVGIGTNNPTSKLHVVGDMTVTGPMKVPKQGDVSMGSYTNGETAGGVSGGSGGCLWTTNANGDVYVMKKVGIGTNSSAYGLYVTDTMKVDGKVGIGANPSSGSYCLALGSSGLTIGAGGLLDFGSGNSQIYDGGGSYYLKFLVYDGVALCKERMRISSAGKVGIGTNTPTQTLTVRGTVGVVATNNAAPSVEANIAQLFATNTAGAELWVMDGVGNQTQLSTHDGLRHILRSHNVYTGEGRQVDVDALGEFIQYMIDGHSGVAAVEYMRTIGQTNIYYRYTAGRIDWDQEQERKRLESVAAQDEWDRRKTEHDKIGKKMDMADRPQLYKKQPKPDWLVQWEQEHPQ